MGIEAMLKPLKLVDAAFQDGVGAIGLAVEKRFPRFDRYRQAEVSFGLAATELGIGFIDFAFNDNLKGNSGWYSGGYNSFATGLSFGLTQESARKSSNLSKKGTDDSSTSKLMSGLFRNIRMPMIVAGVSLAGLGLTELADLTHIGADTWTSLYLILTGKGTACFAYGMYASDPQTYIGHNETKARA